jgi:hypothetical protein
VQSELQPPSSEEANVTLYGRANAWFCAEAVVPESAGTPLPKKLGIRPGIRTYLVHAPAEVRAGLRPVLAECDVRRSARGLFDFVMVFSQSRSELETEVGRAAKVLAPAGMLWASWPKKSSGVLTDLDEHVVRGMGLEAGLVDVKVCAITEIWSGLKFVRRVTERGKAKNYIVVRTPVG